MRNENSVIAEVVLAIVGSVVILCFISALLPQPLTSQSIIDLVINNLINIFIAMLVSVWAVHKFEVAQQRTSFIIDIVDRTNSLCDTMIVLVYKIKNTSEEGLVDEYRERIKALLEYIGAIDQQIESSRRYKDAGELVAQMKKDAQDQADAILAIEKMGLPDAEENNEIEQIIKESSLNMLWGIQTYIPKILGSM